MAKDLFAFNAGHARDRGSVRVQPSMEKLTAANLLYAPYVLYTPLRRTRGQADAYRFDR